MAAPADLYSRLVGLLKLVLPLVALVILSTLFLLAREPRRDAAVPWSQIGAEGVPSEPRLGAPTYAGMTGDGAAVLVTASEARPGADGLLAAAALSARIDLADGSRATIEAAEGVHDPAAGAARFEGGVVFTSSSGWTVRGDRFDVELPTGAVASEGPVDAEGPAGSLEAGRMRFRPGGAGDAVLFDEGVRVIYEPGSGR